MAKKKKGQGKAKGAASTRPAPSRQDERVDERPEPEEETEGARAEEGDEEAGPDEAGAGADEREEDERAEADAKPAKGEAGAKTAGAKPAAKPSDAKRSDAKAAKGEDADEKASDAKAAKSTDDAPASGAVGHEKLVGQAWGEPLVKLDRWWTWFETRLLAAVLLSLIFFMVVWISLKGLALPLGSGSKAGTAFRVLVGVALGGGVAQLATRGRPVPQRNAVTLAAILVGAAIAPAWRAVGVSYAEHILNWLQEGSSLTMFGGLRGIATRLTVLLALVGASLAAASGKHINIDVVLRFLSPKVRKLVFVLSTLATLVVCVSASWGFFDYISIDAFGAKNDAPSGEKISLVSHEIGQDLFLWRRQIGLDTSAMFHVLGGGKWDDESRMNGAAWNRFVEEGGYRDHFTKEEVDQLLAPQESLNDSRTPMVVVPNGSPRGLLLHALDLMWCWGLVNIGLRFVLRMLLVVSGHASADPEPDEFEGVIPSDEETEAEASEIAATRDEEVA